MAAPIVASTTTAVNATDGTSGSITAPATVNAGDLLILWFAHDGVAGTVTPPAGWTELVPDASESTLNVGGAIWVLDAAGTEGGSSVTWSWTTAQSYTAICARVTGWSGAVADLAVSAAAEGVSTAPDATSVTPAHGSDDYLWLTSAMYDSSRFTTVFPYASNNVTAETAPTVGNGMAICSTTSVPGTVLDAGAFTISASEQWQAYTVAVPATPAAPPGTQVADGETLASILATVAGVSALEAEGAINRFMGTSGVPLVKALNNLAGTSGVELQGVLNVLSGTSGVGVDEAARLITWVAP